MLSDWGQHMDLTGPMMLRSVAVYLASLLMVRLSNRRFMGRMSALDIVVVIILGSTLSRAINGGSGLVPTLLSCAAMLALHWLLAALVFYRPALRGVVEGLPHVLVRDGRPQWEELRRGHIPEADLRSAIRQVGRLTEVEEVHLAYLESDGKISVIPRRAVPRVLEVRVADGVQTVRIEIGSSDGTHSTGAVSSCDGSRREAS